MSRGDCVVPSQELRKHLGLGFVRRDLGVAAPPADRDLDLMLPSALPAVL